MWKTYVTESLVMFTRFACYWQTMLELTSYLIIFNVPIKIFSQLHFIHPMVS